MDFRTLQYFSVVAQELNFTRAAERLNMSQPPLSCQIRNLEDDLGVRLFIRGKRKLELTEAGRLLYRRTEQLLELAEKTRSDLASLNQELSGTICIGTVEGRAPFLAARWISGFRKEHPLVNFSLRNGGGDEILDQLHRGLVDIALIAVPYDTEHLEGFPVAREPWVALIPAGHPLAQQPGDTVELRALAGEPLIVPTRHSRVEAIRRWFRGIGAEPDIVAGTANYLDALALVEQGAGISIFPQTTVTPNPKVVRRLITGPAKIAEYALVTEQDQHRPALVEAFINYVSGLTSENGDPAEDDPAEYRIPEGAEIL